MITIIVEKLSPIFSPYANIFPFSSRDKLQKDRKFLCVTQSIKQIHMECFSFFLCVKISFTAEYDDVACAVQFIFASGKAGGLKKRSLRENREENKAGKNVLHMFVFPRTLNSPTRSFFISIFSHSGFSPFEYANKADPLKIFFFCIDRDGKY